MWGKIMIPMYRLWLHGLYGLHGLRCPLSPKRLLNLITHSFPHSTAVLIHYLNFVIWLNRTWEFLLITLYLNEYECNYLYSIHVPGWLQKWLNSITAPGSVSNEPGSVTWLATKYLKTVSWRNHTEKLTTWWPQNISFWPKINIPSSYFTILMLNCLKNTLKLQFDS